MIDTVYIACYRYDQHMVRACAASIRKWHPDVDICLLRDLGKGDFSTSEIQETLSVRVLQLERTIFGWGYSKLEPLFLPERSKFLVLDADTVLLGPVLDKLNAIDADFIVDDETPTLADAKRLYFDLPALQRVDPNFTTCGRNFNSGQWVGTSGLIDRSDFENVLEWSEPPRQTHPEAFMGGEQGVLNYVVEKCANFGRISLARTELMLWSGADLAKLDLDQIKSGQGYSKILHWAGFKYGQPDFARQDIHAYFERQYYARLSWGSFKRRWRYVRLMLGLHAKRARHELASRVKAVLRRHRRDASKCAA